MHDIAEIITAHQLDDQMKMVGEKDISQHGKGMQFFYISKNFAQQVHIPEVSENRLTILYDLCNKNRRAGDIITTKIHIKIIQPYSVGHAFSVTIITIAKSATSQT